MLAGRNGTVASASWSRFGVAIGIAVVVPCFTQCGARTAAERDCAASAVCKPGEVRRDPAPSACGKCGKRWHYRTCDPSGCGFGEPSDAGACEEEGECTPGAQLVVRDQPCGACGGTKDSARTCSAECRFGAPEDGPCRACLDDPVNNSCNESIGQCDCTPGLAGSCHAGQYCCPVPLGFAYPETCWSDARPNCPTFSCEVPESCIPGYHCEPPLCVKD